RGADRHRPLAHRPGAGATARAVVGGLMNDTVAELCSAYLDDELDARERASFERRLASEPDLARELDAMRAVVTGLRALPQVAPSPVVEIALAERVALALEERGLAARLARRFPRIAEQPVIAVMFATV